MPTTAVGPEVGNVEEGVGSDPEGYRQSDVGSTSTPTETDTTFDPSLALSFMKETKTVHELEPLGSLYLDKHQVVAVVSLGVAILLLLTAGLFLLDWRQPHRECHFNMISLDPPAIVWGWTHQCLLAVEMDQWVTAAAIGIAVGILQVMTFFLAVYAKWAYWCKIHGICFVAVMIAFVLALISKLFYLPLPVINPGHFMWQVRGAVFFTVLVLELIFLPVSSGLVYFWTLFHYSAH